MEKIDVPAQTEFDNLDMNLQDFRKVGHEIIDILADYYSTIKERRIISKNDSKTIEQVFNEELPVTGQHPEIIINEWQEKILPNATHLGSPRYFGFVNGSGSMISVLASALATSVNMNSGGWKAGPAATEIERRSIAWIAELINYPVNCGGLFVGGGTIANFAALLTAFRNKCTYNSTDEGLQTDKRKGQYTVYMSDHEGHISIVRAVDMLNLGRNCIRRVPSNADLTLNASALQEMINEDLKAGKIPFCIVAQVGSINVGVIDPLEEIARICSEKGIWFHADGACGAVGAMLPEKSTLYKGLEKADSVTLDPHKWLYIPYECGCLLVKNAEMLRRTFSIAAPYLQGTLPNDYNGLDYFEYGPQMSRGFNALKIWMTIKHYGKEGYQKLLRQNIACASYLNRLVKSSDDFISIHDPQLFIYSFRFFPTLLRGKTPDPRLDAYLDRINQRIADTIMATGFAFIMTSRIRSQVVIRLSICSHRTTLADIENVFTKLQEIGRKLYKDERFE
jgi:glutamate/tyrosine decarboxylase-like PLP-dependent enzyme